MESTQVKVTFQNVGPENGAVISPQWFSFHDGSFDLFNEGDPASSAIELVAEDGITGLEAEIPRFSDFLISQNIDPSQIAVPASTVAGQFAASDAASNGGVQNITTLFRPENPITLGQSPGEESSTVLTLDDAENNRFFSFLSMMFPTNDGFIANEDPLSIEVFDHEGNFVGADLIIQGNQVWDAGTEVNDESPESIPYTRTTLLQGVPEEDVIQPFPVPGFLPFGSGGILSSTDTFGDEVQSFTNADFTQPDYQVARIIISEVNSESGTKNNDRLQGTSKDDLLDGLDGNDSLIGKRGNDTLTGGSGDDELFGDAGDDILNGNDGNDQLFGSQGNDNLQGASGNDQLFGGRGQDTLQAGAGDDFVLGNDGDDTVIITDFSGIDSFNGGSGNDLIQFDPIDGRDLTIFLDRGGVGDGRGGGQTFTNFEEIITGRGDDRLLGNDAANNLNSGNGNDEIQGGAGDDTLQGGAGNDTIEGGAGDDTVIVRDFNGIDSFNGGDGNDQIQFIPSDGRDLTIFLDRGNVGDGLVGGQFFTNFEEIVTGRGNDRLLGDDAANSLNGGNGNDELIGGGGVDTLLGSQGIDILEGGVGNDELIGGGGVDTYRFADDLLDGIADTDTIQTFESQDILDFSAYIDAGGSIGLTRLTSESLRLDLGGEDTVDIFGSAFALNIAESQI